MKRGLYRCLITIYYIRGRAPYPEIATGKVFVTHGGTIEGLSRARVRKARSRAAWITGTIEEVALVFLLNLIDEGSHQCSHIGRETLWERGPARLLADSSV